MLNIKIRAIPNLAHLDGFPRENGVCGNWISPFCIDDYSMYIDTIEFGLQPERREQTLYRIYAKEKEWYGNLGRIVQDLNYIGNCGHINKELLLTRMNCGMKCSYNNCELCYNLLKISEKDLNNVTRN